MRNSGLVGQANMGNNKTGKGCQLASCVVVCVLYGTETTRQVTEHQELTKRTSLFCLLPGRTRKLEILFHLARDEIPLRQKIGIEFPTLAFGQFQDSLQIAQPRLAPKHRPHSRIHGIRIAGKLLLEIVIASGIRINGGNHGLQRAVETDCPPEINVTIRCKDEIRQLQHLIPVQPLEQLAEDGVSQGCLAPMKGRDAIHGLSQRWTRPLQDDFLGEGVIAASKSQQVPFIFNRPLTQFSFRRVIVHVGDGTSGVLGIPLGRASIPGGEESTGVFVQGAVILLDELGRVILHKGRHILLPVRLQNRVEVVDHRTDTQDAHGRLFLGDKENSEKHQEITQRVKQDDAVLGTLINVMYTTGTESSSLHGSNVLKRNNRSIHPKILRSIVNMCCFSIYFMLFLRMEKFLSNLCPFQEGIIDSTDTQRFDA